MSTRETLVAAIETVEGWIDNGPGIPFNYIDEAPGERCIFDEPTGDDMCLIPDTHMVGDFAGVADLIVGAVSLLPVVLSILKDALDHMNRMHVNTSDSTNQSHALRLAEAVVSIAKEQS